MHKWRSQYGPKQAAAKRLDELENEKGWLKKLPAEVHLEDFRAQPKT